LPLSISEKTLCELEPVKEELIMSFFKFFKYLLVGKTISCQEMVDLSQLTSVLDRALKDFE
jgi:hypothetical protein